MDLKKALKEKGISIRKLSIITSIPYTTLNQIVNGKVEMEECQYKTLKPIADYFNVSVDELVYQKEDFQTFRNNLHHRLKSYGEELLLLEILENKSVEYYYENGDILKALYLVSFVDFFSKKNRLPICSEYDSLRSKKLKEPYYVGGKEFADSEKNYISEFAVHNIFEGDLYDAV